MKVLRDKCLLQCDLIKQGLAEDKLGSESDRSTGLGEDEKSPTGETLTIPLSECLFKNISWAASFDQIAQGQGRNILGLVPVRSNLIWRYFLSLLKQRSTLKNLREKRVAELRKLLEKLDVTQLTEDGKTMRQAKVQEIYDLMKKNQTNGNPLTVMMARNLKVFIKIMAEMKRKSRRELENFIKEDEAAQMVDQKMAELEK